MGDRAELRKMRICEQHRDSAAIGGFGAFGDLRQHAQSLLGGVDDRLETARGRTGAPMSKNRRVWDKGEGGTLPTGLVGGSGHPRQRDGIALLPGAVGAFS